LIEIRNSIAKEPSVVIIRNEADFIGLRLLLDPKLQSLGMSPRFRLRKSGQRKQRSGEMFLTHTPEHVGLVLRQIGASPNPSASGCLVVDNPRVMSCSDVLSTKRVCLTKHLSPFDLSVAAYAGIGCIASEIVIDEIVDDVRRKALGEVDGIVRNTKAKCNFARVVNTIKRTAQGVVADIAANIFILVRLDRDSNNV
jgi:hypothetical protein